MSYYRKGEVATAMLDLEIRARSGGRASMDMALMHLWSEYGARDVPVPGQKYTFGIVKAAQARGDFQVLAERGRRALRIHLGPDVPAGLQALDAAIAKAIG